MLPKPTFDRDSGVPIYRQLAEHLRLLAHTGKIQPGQRLPATRDLAGWLGLNRSTVAAAYAVLASEGLVRGHVGRGSFLTGSPGASVLGLDWDELLVGDSTTQPTLFPTARAEECISFATSRPSEELFPIEEFRAACCEVIDSSQTASILQLGSPAGYGPLREFLLDEARRAGEARGRDDVVVTNGCQQALDLIQRVLVRPGDTVLVEDPVYPGLKNVFARAKARLVGVRVGPEGLDVDHLRRLLARETPRLAVLTPNFQNPTGATLPLASRFAILENLREAGAVIVENDIYGELRYEGESIPALKRLDETGDTILLRSFSKVAFPGLRVGWVIGPKALLARLAEAKQWVDLHTDQLSQAVVLRFAESGRLAAHRVRIVAAGAERLAAVLNGCSKYLPKETRFTRPQGGMNLWVQLPEPLDSSELLAASQRRNVIYLPGKYFEVTHHEPGALRLSFAGLEPDKIRSGLAILGEIFSEELENRRGARRPELATALV